MSVFTCIYLSFLYVFLVLGIYSACYEIFLNLFRLLYSNHPLLEGFCSPSHQSRPKTIFYFIKLAPFLSMCHSKLNKTHIEEKELMLLSSINIIVLQIGNEHFIYFFHTLSMFSFSLSINELYKLIFNTLHKDISTINTSATSLSIEL